MKYVDGLISKKQASQMKAWNEWWKGDVVRFQNTWGRRIRVFMMNTGILSECCGATWYYNQAWDRAYCRKCNKRVW